ncbi:CWC16 protein [Dipodascopsis uninucleata]
MQGYNKYYPPDYDGKTSLNKLAGKNHHLGNRARKINQNILVVRFELPFDVFCKKCEKHLGQGTRYNAEKKRIGEYYSTPIFSFKMKCHLCSNPFEIQTDPKNTCYVAVSGVRAKTITYDGESIGAIKLHDNKDDRSNEDIDPFANVEKTIEQKRKIRESNRRITELYEDSARRWSDPYTKNQLLRQIFRNKKRRLEQKETARDRLQWKLAKVANYNKQKEKNI